MMQKPEQTKTLKIARRFAFGSLGLLVLVIILVSVSGGGDAKPKGPDYGDEIGAKVICQQFVERQLKAPSTAKYSDERVTAHKKALWTVLGNVDSENSFGATIRNRYFCQAKHIKGDTWQPVDVELEGN